MTSYSETASQLSEIYNKQPVEQKLFNRGDKIHFINTDRRTGEQFLKVLPASQAKSDFERVAVLKKNKRRTVCGETVYEQVEDVCNNSIAQGILDTRDFKENLPSIDLITECPVIVPRKNGQCDIVCGYDEQTGILAKGEPVKKVSLKEAVNLIQGLLSDYDFQTESDKSRAIANIMTPALIFGKVLKARAPIGMVEADQSQAGKGFLNKIICAMYNERPAIVSQRKGGVGSVDESFDSALVRAKPFVILDNLRGKLDSPHIEAFMTEKSHQARVPYQGSVDIDPSGFILLGTSNNFDMTVDLANRINMVRIRKREMSYQFQQFAEGNILSHLEANQPLYQGALYTIVSEWWNKGKPQTTESRHDFRDWAKPLDWIVQNIFGCAPLLDGHNEAKQCATSPHFQWLRDVSIAVDKFGFVGEELPTQLIAEVCSDSGVEIPSSDGCSFDELDKPRQTQVCSQLGRRLSGLFRQANSGDTIQFGGYAIERKTRKEKFESGKSADINVYTFTRQTTA
jgi:hypothetical protein